MLHEISIGNMNCAIEIIFEQVIITISNYALNKHTVRGKNDGSRFGKSGRIIKSNRKYLSYDKHKTLRKIFHII